jgi:hypothetical protein
MEIRFNNSSTTTTKKEKTFPQNIAKLPALQLLNLSEGQGHDIK